MTTCKNGRRLQRDYRITWVDDGGLGCAVVNPPVSPERLAHYALGRLAGTHVDAVVFTVGSVAGYTTSYPTNVDGMEFLVDRLDAGATLGDAGQWRRAQNLKGLWDAGHDPFQIVMEESRRLGMDFWLQLRMNDWHHVDASGKNYRLIGSEWYEGHPEYLIGADGAAGWPEQLASSLQWFQDFAHEEVRRLRLEVAAEAVERYDVDGWEYDFIRCPGLFKHGQERANAHLITTLIRDTRAMLDERARARGRPLPFSVRVPNTIEGCSMLGIDVLEWMADDLVDIVVPCSFFAQDTEEDASEWVAAAADTPARIHFGMDEGYLTGANQGRGVPYYQVPDPIMQALTAEMVRGISARHWRAGVDGIYLFNGPGTAYTYGYDKEEVLTEIGSPLRIQHKDKHYVVMRRNGSFPNCFPQEHSLPAELGTSATTFAIDVADDIAGAGARVEAVTLKLLFDEACHADRLDVRLNGRPLVCANPLLPGRPAPGHKYWAVYDLTADPPAQGDNEVQVAVQRTERLAEELPLVVSDIELEVSYRYPNGPWKHPPGFDPRT